MSWTAFHLKKDPISKTHSQAKTDTDDEAVYIMSAINRCDINTLMWQQFYIHLHHDIGFYRHLFTKTTSVSIKGLFIEHKLVNNLSLTHSEIMLYINLMSN